MTSHSSQELAAAASLVSRRDVREHIKSVLQPLVDDGTIESDELRDAVKAGGDAVMTLPTDTAEAGLAGYTALLSILAAAGAADTVLGRVRGLQAACERAQAAMTTAADTAATATAAPPKEADAATKKPALTFGAFKERMAKKKEELQSAASVRSEPAPTPAPTTAPATAAVSATASGAVSETPAEPSARVSAAASVRVSPALRPEGGPAPPPAPAPSASEPSRQTPPPSAAPAVPQLTLMPAPVEEVDLYGDIYRGRGRGRGSEAPARGVGGGAWGGRGGAAEWHGPPRGGYARGGGYGVRPPYPGPPARGGYPAYPRGGAFRPY